MIRKNIQITEEQNEQIRKEAFEKEISESELFRRILEKYYDEN